MERLIAKIHILYLSHQYKPSDVLPANDPGMVSAWLDAGSAYWEVNSAVDAEEPEVEPEVEPAEKPAGYRHKKKMGR